MNILLTGASGFLGASLLSRLGNAHKFFCFGRSLPSGAPAGTELIACNLADPADLARATAHLPASIDAVIHFAVSRLHRTFPDTAMDMFQVNVAAAAVLLDYARRAGAHTMVLGSTGSVYDSIKTSPLQEDMTLSPKNYFPISKYAGELLSVPYESMFRIVKLRYFTPYGPHQAGRLIPDLITRVGSGQPVSLPATGDGLAFMATYQDDAVRVAERALLEDWKGTFNVASPEVLTIRSVAESIAAATGKRANFERSSAAPTYQLLPDVSRLESHFANSPFVTFKDGLAATLAAGKPV